MFLLLFRLLNKRLEVTQVGHHVPGEAVLDYSEIGDSWVDLLRCALLGHYAEHVLLLVGLFAELLQRVGLCSHVELWRFALARKVREHLPSLEFLLQAMLVVPLQLLYFFRNLELLGLSKNHRLFFLFLNRLLLLLINLARIRQVVKPFRLISQFLLRIPLQLHFPLNDLVKIIAVRIVLRTLH